MNRKAKVLIVVSLLLVALGVATAQADAPPTVTLDQPTGVSYETAQVSGTVNPQGGPSSTSWNFEYTSEPSNPDSWQFAGGAFGEISGSEAEGTTPIPVGGQLEGLKPDTTYRVRLVASNEGGGNRVVTASPYPVLTTLAIAPATVELDPVSVNGTEATFSGTINPKAPVGNPAASNVNWQFVCTPACTGAVTGFILADASDHPVEVTVSNLDPNTTYEIKLIAENASGATQAIGTFETPTSPPLAETLYAGELNTDSAALAARINPRGSPTTYQFEWGEEGGFGNSAPASPQLIGATDNSFHFVTAQIAGLDPGTDYQFRVTATNTETSESAQGVTHVFSTPESAGSDPTCANAGLRDRQGAGALPECRAWEQVSAVDKKNVDAGGSVGVNSSVQSSLTGDAAMYFANGAFADPQSNQPGSSYLARRGVDGWATESVLPGAETGNLFPGNRASIQKIVSPELDKAAIATERPLAANAPVGFQSLYLRDNTARTYRLTTPLQPPVPFFKNEVGAVAIAASEDFGRIIMRSQQEFTTDSPVGPGIPKLFEWSASDPGTMKYAAILPGGTIDPEGARLGGEVADGFGSVENALSEDGSRLFFSSPPGSSSLYIRESGTTTLISDAARFVTATPEGSEVLFEETNGVLGKTLVRQDTDSGTRVELSPDSEPADGTEPLLRGVAAASEDLSRVYFVAQGRLLPGVGESGANNLYVNDNGTLRFIAVLSPRVEETAIWSYPGLETVSATPDGRRLAFLSTAQLTAGAILGPPDSLTRNLYLYDADSTSLVCASCPREGASTSGSVLAGGSGIGFVPLAVDRNNLSSDGERLFFQTAQALLPNDVNGAADAYMWTETGVRLVTSGRGLSSGSLFMGASPSGDDVFVATRNRLVDQDRDELQDVYDARVQGGIPSQNLAPVVPPPPCVGEACMTPGPGAPPSAPPPSSTLHGPGNPAPKHQKAKAKKKKKGSKKHGGRKAGKGKRR